jgi:hypothetical protein
MAGLEQLDVRIEHSAGALDGERDVSQVDGDIMQSGTHLEIGWVDPVHLVLRRTSNPRAAHGTGRSRSQGRPMAAALVRGWWVVFSWR